MARFGAKRPLATLPLLPVIVVVLDDTKTAPAYFESLRSDVKRNCTLKIVPAARHGATADDVIGCASEARQGLVDPDSKTTVWAIVDLEMASDSDATIKNKRIKAKKLDVRLTLSQPCFEVWILAHFVNTGKRFDSCHAALSEVKKQWKSKFVATFPQKKAHADYEKLRGFRVAAIAHARKHHAANSQSWTEVWQIVESILEFL